MNQKNTWKQFEKTGEINDYLRYKHSHNINSQDTIRSRRILQKEQISDDSQDYGFDVQEEEFR